MKLLICVPSLSDIKTVCDRFSCMPTVDNKRSFLFTCKILNHEASIVIAESETESSNNYVSQILSAETFHLGLKLSLGNAYNAVYPTGSVLNIINDKRIMPLNDNSISSTVESCINKTNAYMNIFLPYKKVVGTTISKSGGETTFEWLKEKYKVDCETTNGFMFSSACVNNRQSFYHLCAIAKNFATGEENFHLANQKLNDTLIHILQKI